MSISDQEAEEPIFGRCPLCGRIVEEAFDYDCQGNEIFKCEGSTCGAVFAQDKEGAYALVNAGGF